MYYIAKFYMIEKYFSSCYDAISAFDYKNAFLPTDSKIYNNFTSVIVVTSKVTR